MHPTLAQVCDRLGDPPRRFHPDDWPDLRIPRPPWADGDELDVVFRDQRLLLKEGEVVWGQIVQANMHLFGPGPRGHPATVIYSRDPDVLDDPALLGDFALRLGRLKREDSDDPDERRYGEMLRDERWRAMRWRAPERLTDGLPVYSTTAMVCRRHLPGRLLAVNFFPLLRHRDTVATMIVPQQFWPARFRDEWADRAAAIADRRPWIRVTDEAAEALERTARQEGAGRDWAVRLWIEPADDGGLDRVRIDLDREFDPRRDREFESNGVRVVIDRRDAPTLRGFVVEPWADPLYRVG